MQILPIYMLIWTGRFCGQSGGDIIKHIGFWSLKGDSGGFLCIMEPVSIDPWDGKSIEEEPVWFQGLLHRIGEEEPIRFLPFVYGTCVCHDCGKRAAYWDWLAKFIGYGWCGG